MTARASVELVELDDCLAWIERYRATPWNSLAHHVTDLAARLEAAERERDHYRFHFDQQEQRAEAAEQRVEALEAALREIADYIGELVEPAGEIYDVYDIARHALEEEQP